MSKKEYDALTPGAQEFPKIANYGTECSGGCRASDYANEKNKGQDIGQVSLPIDTGIDAENQKKSFLSLLTIIFG